MAYFPKPVETIDGVSPDSNGDIDLSGTYAALQDDLSMYAGDLELLSGSPAVGFVTGGGGPNVWTLDGNTDEGVGAVRTLPAHWATFDVDVWWTNGGAGSGNVSWQLSWRLVPGDGAALGSVTNEAVVTVTAPVTLTTEVTTVKSGVAAPAAGSDFSFRMLRDGDNGADTLGNDVWLYKVVFRKAS